MASWIVVPCLVRLRAEFNALAPGRDHASDGTIGDAAHSSSSDHTPDEMSDALRGRDSDGVNEVHAIDVDADLRAPGLSMEQVVQHILARCRSGAEKRLRYIIFNRRIWTSGNDWRQQPYAGPNPHDKHAHFSSTYVTQLEASTASWRLEELDMALSEEQTRTIVREELTAFGQRDPIATVYKRSGEQQQRMALAMTQLANLLGKNPVDEPAIIAGVLAGLNPGAIATAVVEALPAEQAKRTADEIAARLAA